MLLHQNRDEFVTLIALTADHFGINQTQVEKDYFVSLVLKQIGSNHLGPQVIFKGGTSLSKCYQVINRFSEDIDLAVLTPTGRVTRRERHDLKALILSAIEQLHLSITNLDSIRSNLDFNRYQIAYLQTFSSGAEVVPHIIIETIVAYRPFPTLTKYVTNFVTMYLRESGRDDLVREFDLSPFEMLIQSIERTFIDKLFAICDYHLMGKYERYSRHLYDIHMIWMSQEIDREMLKGIVPEIIVDRQRDEKRNPSCKKGAKPNQLLREIILRNVYQQDYIDITSRLIYIPVSYDLCIATLNEITELCLIPEIVD